MTNSIEWILQQVKKSKVLKKNEIQEIFYTAKEMHKEEIEKAFGDGSKCQRFFNNKTSFEYWNELYNTKTKL